MSARGRRWNAPLPAAEAPLTIPSWLEKDFLHSNLSIVEGSMKRQPLGFTLDGVYSDSPGRSNVRQEMRGDRSLATGPAGNTGPRWQLLFGWKGQKVCQ